MFEYSDAPLLLKSKTKAKQWTVECLEGKDEFQTLLELTRNGISHLQKKQGLPATPVRCRLRQSQRSRGVSGNGFLN